MRLGTSCLLVKNMLTPHPTLAAEAMSNERLLHFDFTKTVFCAYFDHNLMNIAIYYKSTQQANIIKVQVLWISRCVVLF